jgi:transposase
MSSNTPNRKNRRATASLRRGSRRALQRVHPNAAGIDVGSSAHWVAVPEERDERPVRSFRSLTADLGALADWLQACGIETVAMESTGVYWIPLYELLEERGFEVVLVNARHVRNVPGRKSDVLDCQWIQQLHSYGLLRGSFRPDDSIVRLRGYLRHREMLVQSGAAHIQHMQKALSQMNIQVHNVLSDITGTTGMRILRGLASGDYDPQRLAEFRDYRCRATREQIAASLVGNYRQEHLFALRQALELYDFYQAQIEACDREIERVLGELAPPPDPESPPLPPPRSPRKRRGNEPRFDVRDPLYRLTGGVDLTQLDGFGPSNALQLIAEIGTDMTRWPTERHFCSWLGVAPGTKITGGKRLSGRTPHRTNRAATILRRAAVTLRNSRTALGAFYRRIAARASAAKAVVATAHKLARIIYAMFTRGTAYRDPGEATYERRYRARLLHSLQKRAQNLGFQLLPIHPPHPEADSVS